MARHTIRVVSWFAALSFAISSLVSSAEAIAQSLARPRITEAVRESSLISLKGNTHPLALSRFDRGRVPDDFSVARVLLLLKRSGEQQAALDSYLAETHTPGSAHYHQWLTPEQFGNLYGPADSDIQAVVAWLQSHGLQVSHVTKGKTAIEFSGTEAQFESAFHTAIHSYATNGEMHHANLSDPQIPSALAPVVAGLSPLNDFRPVPHLHVLGQASYSPETHRATPQWTYPSSTTTESFVLAPADFAVQYDLNPLYTAGVDGTGQTIGIISASNIDISVANAYRSLFGLSANPPQVIIDGSDPGQTSAVQEAYLDVEVAGSVAPKATVNLYTAASTGVQSGLYLAAMRAVEDDEATVLSLSYGSCELNLGSAGNQFWNNLWQQAAAQGQTVFVSAGDGGPAGCDNFDLVGIPASRGLAVSGFASTPWNVAVGGTDFYYSNYAQPESTAFNNEIASYWKTATSTSPSASLLQVIPEQPWNDSSYGLNAKTLYSGATNIVAGSGGASSYALASPSSSIFSNSVQAGYPKPGWQVGNGVPQDGVRDLPDVSLFASNGANYSYYPICANATNCVTNSPIAGAVVITAVGGTSASSPAMAGIMALVNQKYGAQGQANYVFYPMAVQVPSVFHDVTVGSNNVPCLSGTTDCQTDSSGNSSFGKYSAVAGYDLATGLGSVDANLLVTNWNKIVFKPTSTSVTVSPSTLTHGSTATLTAAVSSNAGGVPTGTVSFSPTGSSLAGSSSLTLTGNDGIQYLLSGISSQITLDASGKGQLSTNTLPGGTYQIEAHYGGDGTYGASKSSATSITVTPENSQVNLFGNFGSMSSTGTLYYGSTFLFQAQPVSTSLTVPSPSKGPISGTTGRATGAVTFSESASGLSFTAPIGADGMAYWNAGALGIGAHSVTASYSGDASFNSSKSSTLSFTINQGIPFFSISFNTFSMASNGNLIISAKATTASGATPPTGNLTFTLKPLNSAAAPISVTASLLSGTAALSGQPYSSATAAFQNPPAGSYTVSLSYGGDTNWIPVNISNSAIFQVTASTLQPSSTQLVLNPASVSDSATVIMTATVTGGQGATASPTGTVLFSADGGTTTVAVGTLRASGNGTATAPVGISTRNFASGSFNIIARYLGDVNYGSSVSTAATLQVAGSGDFSIASQAQSLTLKSGASGTITLNMLPLKGFAGTVNLSCIPSSSNIICKLGAASSNISSATTATVTINTQTQVTTTSSNGHRSWPLGMATTVASLLLLGVPARRRSWKSLLAVVILLIALGGMSACGGSSPKTSGGGGGGTTTTTQNAPAGTYSVVITGQANGITHNVKVNVVVE